MKGLSAVIDALREQVAASPSVQRIWAWYDAASPRDQRIVLTLGAAVAALLALFLLVLPAYDFSRSAQQDYRAQVNTLAWMEANRHLATARSSAPGRGDETLLTAATQTAAAMSLTIRRYEPAGENGLNLWLEGVPFAQTMLWLELLERERGIATAEFSARRRAEPGLVDVRVVLEG